MNSAPTVVILTTPSAGRKVDAGATPDAMRLFDPTEALVNGVMATGLPLVLVTDSPQAASAHPALARKDILEMPSAGLLEQTKDWTARAMATAVIARSNAQGWIFLPGNLPMLQATTLLSIARGLSVGLLVFPTFRHQRGRIMGAHAELHADLVRLRSDHDLRRLVSRFPATEMAVDDPGVHMPPDGNAPPQALASPQRSGVVSSPW